MYRLTVPKGVIRAGAAVNPVVGFQFTAAGFVVDALAGAVLSDLLGCVTPKLGPQGFAVFPVGDGLVVHPVAGEGFTAYFPVVYAFGGDVGDDGERYGGVPVPVG